MDKEIEFYKKIDSMFEAILSEVSYSIKGSYSLKSDLKTGESGEFFIKNFLQEKGFKFKGKHYGSEYDLLMEFNSCNYTFEIKTDTFEDTGNLAVEFESRGKPSGITITQSDFFVTYFVKLKQIWNIKTEDLRKLISDNKFKEVTGGDKGSNTKLYLIPKKKFETHFKIHKI
jgi:hypothetical protein